MRKNLWLEHSSPVEGFEVSVDLCTRNLQTTGLQASTHSHSSKTQCAYMHSLKQGLGILLGKLGEALSLGTERQLVSCIKEARKGK